MRWKYLQWHFFHAWVPDVEDIVALIRRTEKLEIDEDDVLSALAIRLPNEDPSRMLHILVNWGRNADLFDYDPERHKLLIEEREPAPIEAQ